MIDEKFLKIILNEKTAKEHLNVLRMARNEGEEYHSTNETILFLENFLGKRKIEKFNKGFSDRVLF